MKKLEWLKKFVFSLGVGVVFTMLLLLFTGSVAISFTTGTIIAFIYFMFIRYIKIGVASG